MKEKYGYQINENRADTSRVEKDVVYKKNYSPFI